VIANDEPHEAIARIEIVELITRLRDVFAARSS